MLVLLIVFMVSAPLLTVGVPLDLPQSQAKSLDQDREPLTVSVERPGPGLSPEQPRSRSTNWCPSSRPSPMPAAALTSAIYVRGDKKVDYGTMMQVMGRLSAAGYRRVALVTEVEQERRSTDEARPHHIVRSCTSVVLGWGLVAFAAKPMEAPHGRGAAGRFDFRQGFLRADPGVKNAPKLKIDDTSRWPTRSTRRSRSTDSRRRSSKQAGDQNRHRGEADQARPRSREPKPAGQTRQGRSRPTTSPIRSPRS